MGLLVRDAIQMARNQLKRGGVEDAETDAELIFRFLMGVDKMGYFKLWGLALDDDVSERFFSLISVRAGGTPLQYITGEQEFMGFTFKVNRNVLIPRQETEVLVTETIKYIKEKGKKNLSVLDLCCGSGVIGISLYKLCENISVTASDISMEAIETAKENAKALRAEKVSFVCGDMFDPFKGRFRQEKYNIIVSNPPYIRSGEIESLQPEIKGHEPVSALDGGVDGLEFYRGIINGAAAHLKKDGAVFFEIGHDQAMAVVEIAATCGTYGDFKVVKDLAGMDRVVILALEKLEVA